LADWLPKEGRFSDISAWINQQFHVQKAVHQNREQAILIQQLQSIQHNMDLEQWPDAKLWTSLRSRLQLHMFNNHPNQPALALPENFSSIQSDIELLQQTARTWLKES